MRGVGMPLTAFVPIVEAWTQGNNASHWLFQNFFWGISISVFSSPAWFFLHYRAETCILLSFFFVCINGNNFDQPTWGEKPTPSCFSLNLPQSIHTLHTAQLPVHVSYSLCPGGEVFLPLPPPPMFRPQRKNGGAARLFGHLFRICETFNSRLPQVRSPGQVKLPNPIKNYHITVTMIERMLQNFQDTSSIVRTICTTYLGFFCMFYIWKMSWS